jgi:mannose-6-phosphate isomerase
VHAHLKGLCVEVMATSDNVLRAGLTTKHVDPAGLVAALENAPAWRGGRMTPMPSGPGTVRFEAGEGVEFAVEVTQVAGEAPLPAPRPAVVVCTSGAVTLHGATTLELGRGESAYLDADDVDVQVSGTAEVLLAHDPTLG